MNPEDRIKSYLTQQKGKIEYASDIDSVVKEIKLFVFYNASPVSDEEIRKVVVQWASIYAIGLLLKPSTSGAQPPATPPPPPPTSSELIDAVKKAMSTINDGVTVGKQGANVNLGVTGLTGNLKSGDGSASLGISWTGALKLNAERGPLHFEGTLSKDKWELTLSFPDDTYIPNLSTLGSIFKEGEKALGTMAGATKSFRNLSDVPNIGALIKPAVSSIEDAVEAASGIANAPKKGGVSFGFKIGSPDAGPGEQGIPRGVQGSVVFTWVF